MAIRIPIISDYYDGGVKKAEKSFKDLAKSSLLTGAAIATVTKFLTDSVKAAAADEKAQQLLAQQLRNTTGATQQQIAEIENFIGKTQDASAVADDKLRPALGNLVRATKDAALAQQLLTLGLDISAATGRDLETVSLALSKAATGQTTALKRLGVPLDENKVKAKDLDGIMADLAKTFGGQATVAADSFEGQMAKMQLAVEDLQEEIGRFLIPILSDLAREIVPVVRKIRDLTGAMDSLGFSIGDTRFSLTNFIGVAAKKAFLGPFALFTQLGEDVKKSDEEVKNLTTSTGELAKIDLDKWFGRLDNKVPNFTKNVKQASEQSQIAGNKMRDAFQKARDGIRAAIDDIIAKRDQYAATIADAVRGTVNFASLQATAKEAGTTFMETLATQVAKAKTFADRLRQLMAAGLSQSALTQVAQAGADAGTAIADELLAGGAGRIAQANDLVAATETAAREVGTLAGSTYYNEGMVLAQQLTQGITDVISKYKIKLSSPGLTEKQLNRLRNRFALDVDFVMQNVPALANGGIVTGGPTLALIGEAGPEAVIPLDRMGQMGNVTINVNGGDPNAVVDALRTYMRQNGAVPIRITNP